MHESFRPLGRLSPTPAIHAPLVERETIVRDHPLRVNAKNRAKASANGAGTRWTVEVEEVWRRLRKGPTIRLKACAKVAPALATPRTLAILPAQGAGLPTLVKRYLDRVPEARLVAIVARADGQTIHDQLNLLRLA